jgi:hypothetical protein
MLGCDMDSDRDAVDEYIRKLSIQLFGQYRELPPLSGSDPVDPVLIHVHYTSKQVELLYEEFKEEVRQHALSRILGQVRQVVQDPEDLLLQLMRHAGNLRASLSAVRSGEYGRTFLCLNAEGRVMSPDEVIERDLFRLGQVLEWTGLIHVRRELRRIHADSK